MSRMHLSTERPQDPKDADFAIYIDFKKGSANPSRVFSAADQLIRALQRLDGALCVSVDSSIRPVLMLEDIEAGSLKVWLKSLLESTDDQAIKELNWKPAVGKYLVRAKYAFIRWTNKGSDASLSDLANEIKGIAKETDVLHLPDYSPPSLQELAAATKSVDSVREELAEGDSLKYLTQEGDEVDFDLSVRWTDLELEDFTVKETTVFRDIPIILIVKKPDYLGHSQWEFRHGKRIIFAAVEHAEWLRKFQNRKYDIRPGDALKCLVTIENLYGYDNELIKEKYTVTEVKEILQDQVWSQSDLLSGDD